jgi:hypothetical protein
MVEDVDENEVREGSIRVGERLRVDDLRYPRRRLDVGRFDPRTGLLEPADAGPEFDRTTCDG